MRRPLHAALVACSAAAAAVIAPSLLPASTAAAVPCAPPGEGPPITIDVGEAGFSAITPVRIADTRNGIGVPAAPVDAGCVLHVPLPSAGVPADAIAVALTLTSDRAGEVGFV